MVDMNSTDDAKNKDELQDKFKELVGALERSKEDSKEIRYEIERVSMN